MSRAVADLPEEPDDAAVRAAARDDSRAGLLHRLSRLPAAHPSSDAYARRPAGDLADEPERQTGNGWDAAGVAGHPDRPAPESLRISPARRTHILDGDVTGGGHRHGTGHHGKTEFPADWDDGTIMENILDVARRPGSVHQQWNGRWKGRGEGDGVDVTTIINPDGSIWTAWPEEGGRGVIRNLRKDTT